MEIQKAVRKTKISLPNKYKLPQGLSLPVTAATNTAIPSSPTVKVKNISLLRGGTSKSEAGRTGAEQQSLKTPKPGRRREGAADSHPALPPAIPRLPALGHWTVHAHPYHANPLWKIPVLEYSSYLFPSMIIWDGRGGSAMWLTHDICNSKAISWWRSGTDGFSEERPSRESMLWSYGNKMVPRRGLPCAHTGKTLVGQTRSSSTKMKRGKKLHGNIVQMETYTYIPLPPTQPRCFYNHNCNFCNNLRLRIINSM